MNTFDAADPDHTPTGPDRGPTVVGKIGLVLRALGAAADPAGSTTSDIARRTGLTRPTAHRLLTELAEQGFTDRDTGTGRWQLGPELYLLGAVAATRYDVTDHARDILADLAEQTGESAFLSALRGRETVCLAEIEGSFPLRSHVLHLGIRFPLGVASAGLAILSHLPTDEADDYVATTDLTTRWGRSHSRRAVRARVAATREHGYAVNPGLIIEDSWGMAAAVFDESGRPRAALSLTGVRSRFTDARIPTLGRLLLDRAHALGRRVR
ncbi:IclR family transcriptional regulator [Pseudonocardia sp. N23]|uniref:IclR family transcriptional regulator n=1 Tax=Pseudonocardia sp. N23 TaxID=1987376 RepID=UPI000C02AD14|nr:IclR family transcriptional regulator [Pseudonocardia sp. N23]GAY07219.1 transcriptional regulator, IclR family [Pseudonocardia sp. N23]